MTGVKVGDYVTFAGMAAGCYPEVAAVSGDGKTATVRWDQRVPGELMIETHTREVLVAELCPADPFYGPSSLRAVYPAFCVREAALDACVRSTSAALPDPPADVSAIVEAR